MSKSYNATRPFPPGVYVPLTTPFTQAEELDLPAWEAQIIRMVKAGVGLVLMGTNGEAAHLSSDERVTLIKSARAVLDKSGYPDVPLLVGTGTGSAKETIKLAKEAKEAGADYSIVIHPGYFSFALGSNRVQALKEFFLEVLDKSVLPVMVYNFPAAASGIDLDSDTIKELSNHPNCFGCKLTCAGIGKGNRIASYTQSEEYLSKHPPFQVFPGYCDYLLPALVSGQTGTICGTGNLFPCLVRELYDKSMKALDGGSKADWKEAQRLQDLVSNAEWVIVKGGISGTKYALDKFIKQGLGGYVRKPLPAVTPEIQKMMEKELQPVFALEASLKNVA